MKPGIAKTFYVEQRPAICISSWLWFDGLPLEITQLGYNLHKQLVAVVFLRKLLRWFLSE